jgi:hypothetical protein
MRSILPVMSSRVIASEAKQSIYASQEVWVASLRSQATTRTGPGAPMPFAWMTTSSLEGTAKQPEIRVSGGFFAASGLVFSYPIRFHCTPSGVPLIP